MSRPTKLDEQTKMILCKAIEAGMNYEDACRFARITYRSFRNWMKAGEKAKSGIYFQFFQDIEFAKAKGLAFHLSVVNNAARSGDWHASRFILQARHKMVIEREPQPQLEINVHANQFSVQELLEQVQENQKLLSTLQPVIDLDEE